MSAIARSLARNNERPLRLVFIAGTGRSGSTLLGNALGELSGCVHGGELGFVLGQHYGQNRVCGCGRSIGECAEHPDSIRPWCPRVCGCGELLGICGLWNEVQREAFEGLTSEQMSELGRFSYEIMKYRPTALFRLYTHQSSRDRALALRYVQALERVYSALASVTNAETVIDSSKHAMHVYLLAQLSNMNMHVIHLVRDPRALSYSWRRRRTDEVVGGPVRVALNWTASNFAIELLQRRASATYTRVRYEEFIQAPQLVLERLGAEIGVPGTNLPFVNPTTLQLDANHAVAGSPSRAKIGAVEVIPDNEWKANVSRREQLTVTAVSSPFLHRYGYSLTVR